MCVWRDTHSQENRAVESDSIAMASSAPPFTHVVEVVSGARHEVLGNIDLLASVLAHAELDPVSFVCMGLVSKTWRSVCLLDEALLLKAARAPRYLTKGVFAGLFGLTSVEANQFPRGQRAHRGSFLYMYRRDAIDAVMPAVGGMPGWLERKARQAAYQKAGTEQFGHTSRRALGWLSRDGAKRQRAF